MKIVISSESVATLDVVGADGTAVNTGCANGIIRLLELQLKRPLQRAICQLHLNELPFRHVFKHIDGKTTGPSTYSGVIGSAIENELVNLKVVKFLKVRGRVKMIPQTVLDQFTGDQRYLYEICIAVQTGEVYAGLELKSPGKLSEARWLTKANRILRLYISSNHPTENLDRYIIIL